MYNFRSEQKFYEIIVKIIFMKLKKSVFIQLK